MFREFAIRTSCRKEAFLNVFRELTYFPEAENQVIDDEEAEPDDGSWTSEDEKEWEVPVLQHYIAF